MSLSQRPLPKSLSFWMLGLKKIKIFKLLLPIGTSSFILMMLTLFTAAFFLIQFQYFRKGHVQFDRACFILQLRVVSIEPVHPKNLLVILLKRGKNFFLDRVVLRLKNFDYFIPSYQQLFWLCFFLLVYQRLAVISWKSLLLFLTRRVPLTLFSEWKLPHHKYGSFLICSSLLIFTYHNFFGVQQVDELVR